MSKRILVIVLTVCLAVVGMTVMTFADNIASGTDWVLAEDGKLTISSDTGMTNWYNNGRSNATTRESVKSVVIESGVATICDSAFYNCTNLASVTIPSSVTSIGDKAFQYCSGLTSITIPSDVTSIGSSAFANSGLTSITIPSSVTSIGYGVFSNCTSLTSITIPSSVTSIGNYAFEYSGLTSIIIPDTVENLGTGAFQGCENLKTAFIGSNVTKLDSTFQYCYSLTNVYIAKGVTEMYTVFALSYSNRNVRSITDIYYSGTETEWNSITKTTPLYDNSAEALIHYNSTSMYSYTLEPKFTWSEDYSTCTLSFVCSECGSAKSTYDCTVTSEVTTKATCTGTGLKTCTATVTVDNSEYKDVVQNVVVAATGHQNVTHFVANDPTCTEAGNIEYWYCSDCGKYFSDSNYENVISQSDTVIAAIAHKNAEKVAAVDATCTTAGNIEYWYCSDCDCYFSDADCTQEITQAETITSALGHTLQHFEAVEAGCDTVGNVEYWYCGDCDTYFSDADATAEITLSQTVVAATGEHEYEVSAIVWNYEDGTATVKCLECGEYHTFDATVTSKNVLGQKTYTITTTINGTEYTDTKTTGTSLMMVQASYSAVIAAIEKANSLNPSDYEDFTPVTDAINAVDWSLSVLNQREVNSYAEAIEEAINNLVPAETVNITEETIEVIDPVEAGETDSE